MKVAITASHLAENYQMKQNYQMKIPNDYRYESPKNVSEEKIKKKPDSQVHRVIYVAYNNIKALLGNVNEEKFCVEDSRLIYINANTRRLKKKQ